MEQAVGHHHGFEVLQDRVVGMVVDATHPDYEKARRAWNLVVDQHPTLIVFAQSAQDVVEAVRYANEEGLRIAVTATGHGVVRPADGAMLINLSQMNGVTVYAAKQTVRIEGGAKWGAVLEKTQVQGLAPLLGSSPDVGAVGYTLGGGLGWLARKYGLSADSVVAFEVVTSDGRVLRASADENADLFWGLRGGGGSLAIVTAMEVRLYPITSVYGGNLFYPATKAREVMTRYREWIATAPDELTSSIVLMNFPPMPELPEFLRGQSFAIVRGCYAGPPAQGEKLLSFWRDWQAPAIDDFKEIPFSQVATISNDPVDPLPGLSSGAWIRALDDGAIETLVRFGLGDGAPSPLTVTEVRHAGGAIARVDGHSAAYGNRDAQHIMQIIAMTPTPVARAAVLQHLGAFKEALQPYLTGGVYMNFLEGEEAQARVRDGFAPDTFRRLSELKAQFDPRNVLGFSANIEPAPVAPVAP